jgi:hypothetical protein
MSLFAALTNALKETFEELQSEIADMPLPLWNESVFRYFLARNIQKKHKDSMHIACEWHGVDLAIAFEGVVTAVEIKFWTLGNLMDESGMAHPLAYRKAGGPGKKNKKEFDDVIKKLETIAQKAWGNKINAAYLVLVYADPSAATAKAMFGRYYDSLEVNPSIREVYPIHTKWNVDHSRLLTCKLFDIVLRESNSDELPSA